jgi:hypothetical protein
VAYTSWPEKAPWPGRWTPIDLAPLRFYQRRFPRSAQKQQSPLILSGCGLSVCFCGLFPPGGAFPSGKHTAEAPGQPYPPHPLENILGLILTGFFLLVLTDWALLGVTLAISLPLEALFCPWYRCPPEKIWQSWLPVLLLAWIFAPAFSPIGVAWGGWGLRTLMLTLYMPRLAYLCLGSVFFYLLICT